MKRLFLCLLTIGIALGAFAQDHFEQIGLGPLTEEKRKAINHLVDPGDQLIVIRPEPAWHVGRLKRRLPFQVIRIMAADEKTPQERRVQLCNYYFPKDTVSDVSEEAKCWSFGKFSNQDIGDFVQEYLEKTYTDQYSTGEFFAKKVAGTILNGVWTAAGIGYIVITGTNWTGFIGVPIGAMMTVEGAVGTLQMLFMGKREFATQRDVDGKRDLEVLGERVRYYPDLEAYQKNAVSENWMKRALARIKDLNRDGNQ